MNRIATIAAVIVTASVGTVVALDENRPEPRLLVTLDAGTECVIPDCRTMLGRGAWDDDHAPVDCLATGPYSPTGVGVWRGCSVFRAEYSTGTQCLPARCAVIAGEDPLEVEP